MKEAYISGYYQDEMIGSGLFKGACHPSFGMTGISEVKIIRIARSSHSVKFSGRQSNGCFNLDVDTDWRKSVSRDHRGAKNGYNIPHICKLL